MSTNDDGWESYEESEEEVSGGLPTRSEWAVRLADMLSVVNEGNLKAIVQALKFVHERLVDLLLERCDPLNLDLSPDCFAKIVALIHHPKEKVQVHAIQVVIMIGVGSSANAEAVVKAGVMSMLVERASKSLSMAERCLWGLNLIVREYPPSRVAIFDAGIVPKILAQLGKPDLDLEFKSQIVALIELLLETVDAETVDAVPDFSMVKPLVPALGALLDEVDEEVIRDAERDEHGIASYALLAIKHVCERGPEAVDAVLEAGILPKVVRIMGMKGNLKNRWYVTILGIFCEIVAAGKAVNARVLDEVVEVFQAKEVRDNFLDHKAYQLLCLFADGGQEKMEAILESRCVPKINSYLRQCASELLRSEETPKQSELCVCRCSFLVSILFKFLVSGNNRQVKLLLDTDFIPPLFQILESATLDFVLEGLVTAVQSVSGANKKKFSEAVQKCGGLAILEKLQKDEDEEIGKMASDIIEGVSKIEEADDDEDNSNIEELAAMKVSSVDEAGQGDGHQKHQ